MPPLVRVGLVVVAGIALGAEPATDSLRGYPDGGLVCGGKRLVLRMAQKHRVHPQMIGDVAIEEYC